MRRPTFNMNVFRERRQTLAKRAQGSAIIIPSHPEYIRNHDVHHPYRQDSSFFYLTGWEEPDSILVIRPGQTPETIMFVRPKDVERETWDGFRYGPEGAEREFKVDKAYLISDFDKVIVDLLKPVDRVYYRWNISPDFDKKMLGILDEVRASLGRSGRGHLPVQDSWELIGEMRVLKSAHEVELMRKACQITSQAHIDAMKFTRPGVNERQVQGVVLSSFYKNGAQREGYNSIVATGANATTLHYVFNDQPCKDGDLLLIDAGAEYEYFTSDITRTFPVNGKFTAPQKKVYQAVLDIQKELCASIKPGLVFKSLQERTIDFLTDKMLEMGLLKGSRKHLIDTNAFKKYYPHGVGHFLGMDVHDIGLHTIDGEPRKLETGMAFTIEPGLYIPFDDMSAPEELRGIGVRIEDDVVVTSSGVDILTKDCPKEISDMEKIIGTGL
ncbi:MAG TPA: aminopeptidase P N-terminal domain-containing protein [Bdellovibrionales bacterium]|nr:aminopeptidase P N-terminal domain-containing protein [Bdellovibrionales bacterium]